MDLTAVDVFDWVFLFVTSISNINTLACKFIVPSPVNICCSIEQDLKVQMTTPQQLHMLPQLDNYA